MFFNDVFNLFMHYHALSMLYLCFIHALSMHHPLAKKLTGFNHFYLLMTNKVNVLFNRNFDDRIVD
jgi:hypothetical protein